MALELTAIYIFTFLSMFFGLLSVVAVNSITTVVAVNLFSTASACAYFFLNAPDVSMTEVSIGVFLSTAFFLMTVRICKVDIFEWKPDFKLVLALVLFVVVCMVFYSIILSLQNFGEVGVASAQGSSIYYLESSYRDYHIANVITTILASFRGYDTMGEAIIILISGFGVYFILQPEGNKYTSL